MRFVIVILFGLSQFIISVLLNTLNPIASILCKIYGESSVVVNLGGLLFALMHPIFTFPASYVIDTFGTRTGIILGSILALIGVGLRALVNINFGFVIAGQVIAGIGRPFILNCQAKISANWFSAKTRGRVTQILTLILNVSLVIGMLIPGIFFKGYKV
jgi:FLVCR family feline leukemia virus subgroup C receptor-related protein